MEKCEGGYVGFRDPHCFNGKKSKSKMQKTVWRLDEGKWVKITHFCCPVKKKWPKNAALMKMTDGNYLNTIEITSSITSAPFLHPITKKPDIYESLKFKHTRTWYWSYLIILSTRNLNKSCLQICVHEYYVYKTLFFCVVCTYITYWYKLKYGAYVHT